MAEVIRALKIGAQRVIDDVRSSTVLEADLLDVRQEQDDFVIEVFVDGTTVSWTLPKSDEAEAAVFVADGLQYDLEIRLREPWPRCSGTPQHSLRPTLVRSTAQWVCSDDDVRLVIGYLSDI